MLKCLVYGSMPVPMVLLLPRKLKTDKNQTNKQNKAKTEMKSCPVWSPVPAPAAVIKFWQMLLSRDNYLHKNPYSGPLDLKISSLMYTYIVGRVPTM